jgi:hypothetical protein
MGPPSFPGGRWLKAGAVLALLLGLATPARPGPAYTFTRIADSTQFDAFAGFQSLSLNASGTVAFLLRDDARGLFTGNGGALTRISLQGPSGPVSAVSIAGYPSLNAAGAIALHGAPQGGGDGLYIAAAAAQLVRVADNLGGFPFLGFANPSINDAGRVAFVADFNAGHGVFRSEPGGGFTTIADNSGRFDGFVNNGVSINAAGSVAFYATSRSGAPNSAGVFVGSGGALTTVALAGGLFDGFAGTPVINAAGQVVFQAGLSGGAAIFVGDGGSLRLVADTGGPFGGLQSPYVNDSGAVVFVAGLRAGGNGLFTGPDPALDRVIAYGDPLFGSTVLGVGGLVAENDGGQVAFVAFLTDGETVLLRADPAVAVPEPASLTLFGLGAAGLVACRWRRRGVA